jgi:serine/threonine protein kinase
MALPSAVRTVHPHMIGPGSQFGRFQLESALGSGGNGVVYRAVDPRLDRHVAVKVLRPELSIDTARVQRFLAEARLASKLNHPNIVTIYEAGESDSQVYVAMELVEGDTLRALHKAGRIPTIRGLQIICQMAEALATAHEAGIAHRDFNPRNVMVRQADGSAQLLDFGVAVLTSHPTDSNAPTAAAETRLTPVGTIVGTVAYSSPEQFRGEAIGFASDQFSLAVTMCEILSGTHPFHRDSVLATIAAICNEPAPDLLKLNTQLPYRVQQIIRRCLSKDPSRRYASTRDLARDLADSVDEYLQHALHPDPARTPEMQRIGEQIVETVERELTAWAADIRSSDPFQHRLRLSRVLQSVMVASHYLLSSEPGDIVGSNMMMLHDRSRSPLRWCVRIRESDLRWGNIDLVLRIAYLQGYSYYIRERKFKDFTIFIKSDTTTDRLGTNGRTIQELFFDPMDDSFALRTVDDLERLTANYNVLSPLHNRFIDGKYHYGVRVTGDYDAVYREKASLGYFSHLTELERSLIKGIINIPIFASDPESGLVDWVLGTVNIDLSAHARMSDDKIVILGRVQSLLNRSFVTFISKCRVIAVDPSELL